MPYLDMSDPENFDHLAQLFLAAHPQHKATNDAMRVHFDTPGQYYLTRELAQEVAAWGRQRQIITRKDAARLVEATRCFLARPEEVITIGRHWFSGQTPPRFCATVSGSALFGWLFCHDANRIRREVSEEHIFTVEAAIKIAETEAAENEDEQVRSRAVVLRDWLRAQQAKDTHA